MENELKIAIVGCGKQAPKHISGLRKVPGVQLVLADARPEAARALAEREKVAWVERPEDVFADPSVAAVDICTPTPSHASLIRASLASGKDFFCEKPLCENASEGRDLAAEVERSGRIGMIGYIYRFAPVFEVGLRLCRDAQQSGSSDVLGALNVAHFRIGGRGSHQLWKHRRSTAGGAANEMLVHMLDLAIWYFGRIVDAEVLARDLLRPRREINGEVEEVDAEDYVQVRLRTESGVNVFCQADLVTPAFTQFVELQGDNGTFMGSIDPQMPSFVFCNRDAVGWEAGRTAVNVGPLNLFEAQMAEFIRAVRTGTPPDRCTVRDSVLVLEAMEMIEGGPNA